MNKPLRFAFDLGSTSLGWAVLGLKQIEGKFLPDSIIKAGVRIFRMVETRKVINRLR